MGQAGSSAQQQQQDEGDSRAKQHVRARERERDSPRTLRSNPGLSRSLRRADRGERNEGDDSRDGDIRDGASSSGAGSGSGSGKVPRRKSLDMPDMSLSMTGAGSLIAPPTAAPTPNLSVSPVASRGAASAVSDYSYPYAGQRIDASTGDGLGQEQAGLPGDDGLPMALTSLNNIPTSPQYPGTTSSPSAAAQAKEAASRWARRKDKEGFGKKAQPVTGSASALHAVAFNSAQSQPGSPAGPAAETSNKPSLYPVLTGNIPLNAPFSPSASVSSAAAEQKTDVWHQNNYQQQQALQGNVGTTAIINRQQLDQQAQTHALTHPPSELPYPFSSPTGSNSGRGEGHLSDTLGAPFNVPIPTSTPLVQPVDSILAPELPHNVQLTVPPYDSATAAHDIVGPSTPDLGALSEEAFTEGSNLAAIAGAHGPTGVSVAVAANAGAANAVKAANYSSPLIPGSTPPLGNPPNTLPAAVPFAAVNLGRAQNLKTQEAVQAATVDLGAGPDGVTTLLTWKAAEEEGEASTGGFSGPKGDAARPQQVFVTGTFAKGWGTKIELRRKE